MYKDTHQGVLKEVYVKRTGSGKNESTYATGEPVPDEVTNLLGLLLDHLGPDSRPVLLSDDSRTVFIGPEVEEWACASEGNDIFWLYFTKLGELVMLSCSHWFRVLRRALEQKLLTLFRSRLWRTGLLFSKGPVARLRVEEVKSLRGTFLLLSVRHETTDGSDAATTSFHESEDQG